MRNRKAKIAEQIKHMSKQKNQRHDQVTPSYFAAASTPFCGCCRASVFQTISLHTGNESLSLPSHQSARVNPEKPDRNHLLFGRWFCVALVRLHPTGYAQRC
jgi:hypothetical protein